MAEARIVLTTLSDEQQAADFAAELVERRLAACVNIVGPIRSIYRWKGKVERESRISAYHQDYSRAGRSPGSDF